MNQQLHRLALELLVVSFLNLLFLHGFSLFTLSFRVRKIRGGSECPSIIPSLNCSRYSGESSEPSPQYIDYGGIFNISKFSCMLKFKNCCLFFGWNCSFHWLGCICFCLLFVPPLKD